MVHVTVRTKKVHYPIPKQITFIQAAQFRQAMAQQRQPSKRQFHTTEIQQRHFDQVNQSYRNLCINFFFMQKGEGMVQADRNAFAALVTQNS